VQVRRIKILCVFLEYEVYVSVHNISCVAACDI
jgi:hypothetical protein